MNLKPSTSRSATFKSERRFEFVHVLRRVPYRHLLLFPVRVVRNTETTRIRLWPSPAVIAQSLCIVAEKEDRTALRVSSGLASFNLESACDRFHLFRVGLPLLDDPCLPLFYSQDIGSPSDLSNWLRRALDDFKGKTVDIGGRAVMNSLIHSELGAWLQRLEI